MYAAVSRSVRPALLVAALCLRMSAPFAQSLGATPAMDGECGQTLSVLRTSCAQDSATALRSCILRKLSARCSAQAAAPADVPRDTVCTEEFRIAVGPCGQEMESGVERCAQSRLSDKCKAQAASTAAQVIQQTRDKCMEESFRRLDQVSACNRLEADERRRCLELVKPGTTPCR